MADMIAISEAMCYIRSKKDLHEACVRNGYLTPPLRDSMCSKKFLLGIKDGKYWCLKSE